jgi:hypothetical protein
VPDGVFVFDGDDATVFWSLDEASRWLDADEVRAGAYEILTLEGHVVVATTRGQQVELEVAATRSPQALADRLGRTCRALGLESSPDDVPGVAREVYRRDW